MIEPWQRTLIRSLFPYDPSKLAIEASFATKFPHIPNRLYKYRSFKKPHMEALEAGQLWFSSPNGFNDPFDTTVYFDSGRFNVEDRSLEQCLTLIQTLQEMVPVSARPQLIENPIPSKEWLLSMTEALCNELPFDTLLKIKDITSKFIIKENQNMTRLMSDHLRSGFSVLCLSANSLSNPMWSHYSDSHRGFCIEFNFGSLPYENFRKRMCFPVFYRSKRTDATRYMAKRATNFNNLFGYYLCLMKSSEWAYEQEWRIVHATGAAQANAALWMPAPSAIILGAEVSGEDADWARLFCKRKSIALKYVKKDLSTQKLIATDTDEPWIR